MDYPTWLKLTVRELGVPYKIEELRARAQASPKPELPEWHDIGPRRSAERHEPANTTIGPAYPYPERHTPPPVFAKYRQNHIAKMWTDGPNHKIHEDLSRTWDDKWSNGLTQNTYPEADLLQPFGTIATFRPGKRMTRDQEIAWLKKTQDQDIATDYETMVANRIRVENIDQAFEASDDEVWQMPMRDDEEYLTERREYHKGRGEDPDFWIDSQRPDPTVYTHTDGITARRIEYEQQWSPRLHPRISKVVRFYPATDRQSGRPMVAYWVVTGRTDANGKAIPTRIDWTTEGRDKIWNRVFATINNLHISPDEHRLRRLDARARLDYYGKDYLWSYMGKDEKPERFALDFDLDDDPYREADGPDLDYHRPRNEEVIEEVKRPRPFTTRAGRIRTEVKWATVNLGYPDPDLQDAIASREPWTGDWIETPDGLEWETDPVLLLKIEAQGRNVDSPRELGVDEPDWLFDESHPIGITDRFLPRFVAWRKRIRRGHRGTIIAPAYGPISQGENFYINWLILRHAVVSKRLEAGA